MCLTANTTQPFVTDKDIECYKFLIKKAGTLATIDGEVKTKWESPFRDYRWQLGKTLSTRIDHGTPTKLRYYEVDEGFHSLLLLHDIKENVNMYNAREHGASVVKIFKCIIPKGSKVYRGYWETANSPGYTSDTIIVKRQINFIDTIVDTWKKIFSKKTQGQIIYDFL